MGSIRLPGRFLFPGSGGEKSSVCRTRVKAAPGCPAALMDIIGYRYKVLLIAVPYDILLLEKKAESHVLRRFVVDNLLDEGAQK